MLNRYRTELPDATILSVSPYIGYDDDSNVVFLSDGNPGGLEEIRARTNDGDESLWVVGRMHYMKSLQLVPQDFANKNFRLIKSVYKNQIPQHPVAEAALIVWYYSKEFTDMKTQFIGRVHPHSQ